MKRGIQWAVALLIVLLLAGGVLRALSARQAQQQAMATASSGAKDQRLVELAETDVFKAQTREVTQGLAVTGALKAVNSAMVKARVAGELQGLTLREGDFVKAGQTVARIDASDIQSRVRQAREQAQSARAQVDMAQRQYDNNKALVDQGFISKTALDTSLASLNAAQSTHRAAQAATDIAAKAVEDTVLKAPISGQVSQRLAQPGERVGLDSKILEIVDLSRLELEASLSAADAMEVRVGQRAELQIEGSAQTVAATVARINPSAQAGSRSVLVYLSMVNPGQASALPLRQGLFAQGTLGTARSARLAVPVSSVRTDKPEPYVQTVENGKVVHRAVTPGARGMAGNEPVLALTGLPEDTLVIRGQIGVLREGTLVRFTPVAGAPAAVKPAP
ncbi:efflux RND transporter periplasmic adaptor subunit [Polaromonas sp.]|uniref:efflux RND transporter periplasmic adaptor subunit n=1 Tax=Polaromonas sp. TaxID=1869339 RepID=UPI00286B209A|nr:efflux RND transporter periplasmic adaptor subunit [Polaromonas sp.]